MENLSPRLGYRRRSSRREPASMMKSLVLNLGLAKSVGYFVGGAQCWDFRAELVLIVAGILQL